MTNVSRLIFAIVAVSIAGLGSASPVLAAQKGKPISAHQNGYVARSRPVSDVYIAASPVSDPASRPYHYDPGSAPNGQ